MKESQPDIKVIPLYQAHQKIYPRSISGYFTTWRWIFVWLTQLLFYGLPWLQWGGRQAVLFDLETKRFFILGLVFYPQDFIYLSALLIISALSLFLFTAIAGRLWCGYACPQTVYSEIFLWIEQKFEGDRSSRLRIDKSSLTLDKLVRKFGKHCAWITVAFWTGLSFVGYFTPIRHLVSELAAFKLSGWESFWVGLYSLATYGNAGFLREQVCKYMCPYARFQSAMLDRDTLIVAYDEARGEPRGAKTRKSETARSGVSALQPRGDCIDCSLCVQVCPTGIDIREGLQYECIGCGACADACDSVMTKQGLPLGLVRYSTQNAISHRWSSTQMRARILRPRVLAYSLILLAVTALTFTALYMRVPFRADVVRDRTVMARLVENGLVENVYRVQIMNSTERTLTFNLSTQHLEKAAIHGPNKTTLEPAQSNWMVVKVRVPPDAVAPGTHHFEFLIEADSLGKTIGEGATFVMPR